MPGEIGDSSVPNPWIDKKNNKKKGKIAPCWSDAGRRRIGKI
jgi:hypothetical protein